MVAPELTILLLMSRYTRLYVRPGLSYAVRLMRYARDIKRGRGEQSQLYYMLLVVFTAVSIVVLIRDLEQSSVVWYLTNEGTTSRPRMGGCCCARAPKSCPAG